MEKKGGKQATLEQLKHSKGVGSQGSSVPSPLNFVRKLCTCVSHIHAGLLLSPHPSPRVSEEEFRT